MPTIAAARQHVLDEGLPVLFLDTCILLDVVRATLRCNVGCIERAVDLLERATRFPPKCLIVAASLVPHEWTTRVQDVTEEVERHLAKIEEQSRHFHDACAVLGISLGFGRATYSSLGLATRLRVLSQQLVAASVCLDPDSDSTIKAFGRVVANLPPARKGGEVKDCAILEEYLELARQVRVNGFARKLVFCTSNANDYCAAGGSPYPNLATDFSAVNLLFTTNLPWAVHEISSG